jgi:CBS domain-containing protein
MMRDDDIGAVPVGENDRLIGNRLTAGEVMSKPIVYCRSDEDLEDALRIMEKNRIRRLPVIDENKRLLGMRALGDISEKGGRDLAGEVLRSVSSHHA